MSLQLLAIAAFLATASPAAATTWCYDRYNRSYYRCLSTGERIAIGVCVGVGVFLLFSACGMMRRKQLRAKMNQYRPPPPATMTGAASANPYANNPPPPTGAYGTGTTGTYGGMSGGYAGGVAPPANSYQPQGNAGLASQYYGTDKSGPATDIKGTPMSDNPNELADHSYEYAQAQANNASSPPGYDMPTGGYASPSGPPPSNIYASPSGPPPGRN